MRHVDFMAEAARLAREGAEKGDGGPFGAVVVDADGRIVGAAHNRVVALNDPTAHAEILALRAAGAALDRFHLTGCELYTTCEPCPMCLAAVHWARIERVYFTLTRHDAAGIGFADERIYAAMEAPLIEMQQVACDAAADAFRVWRDKPDHVEY